MDTRELIFVTKDGKEFRTCLEILNMITLNESVTSNSILNNP
jgi:hypothetical protein